MSRSSSVVVGPLKLSSSSSMSAHQPVSSGHCSSFIETSSQSSSNAPPPAPKRPTKSLGVRKVHASGSRYHALPMSNTNPVSGGSIKDFFPKKHSSTSTTPNSSQPDENTPSSAINIHSNNIHTTTAVSNPQQQLQFSQSPSASPECTPPQPRSLFSGAPQAISRENSFSFDPLPSFDSQPAGNSNAHMWDSTPPNTDAAPSVLLPHQSKGPPPAPQRAPKKPAHAQLNSFRAPHASTLPPPPVAPSALSMALLSNPLFDAEQAQADAGADADANAENSNDSEAMIIPFKLNICSQPTQSQSSQQDALTPAGNNNGMLLDQDESLPLHLPLASRSSSMCSDIVVQASQEPDDIEDVNNNEAPPNNAALTNQRSGCNSAITSQTSTPVLGPINSADGSGSNPQQLSSGFFSGASDFRLFNESIATTANPRSSANNSPFVVPSIPTRSNAFSAAYSNSNSNEMLPPPAVNMELKRASAHAPLSRTISRNASFFGGTPGVAAASTTSASIAASSFFNPGNGTLARTLSSQTGAGLPPPAPSRTGTLFSSQQQQQQQQPPSSQNFHQTTLNHMIRANSTSSMQGGSQNEAFPHFAAAAHNNGNNNNTSSNNNNNFQFSQTQISQTQMLPRASSIINTESGGHSLESYPSCASFYCTPQDQPIRERTAFEMSEELFLQRENVAWQNQQQQISSHTTNNAPPMPQPLNASMRTGSGSGSNGFMAPPALKKARYTVARSGPVMQPNADSQMDDQPMQQQQQQQQQQQPLTIENPFLAAQIPNENSSSSNNSAAGASKQGKKRAIDNSSTLIPSFPTNNSSRLYNDFEYIRQFGIGCFGFVFLVKHRLDGTNYAVKKSKNKLKGANSTKIMMKEVQILSYLGRQANKPRSILQYHTCWIEEGHLYIQMEYCEGGSLASIMKKHRGPDCGANNNNNNNNSSSSSSAMAETSPFDSEELLQIALQMSQALAFMHQHNLVHLDLKPDNILCFKRLTNSNSSSSSSSYASDCTPEYRLADFGLACSAKDGSSNLLAVGDKRYLPTEALEDSIADLRAVDLFALGVTLYELATGCPFELPMSQMEMMRIRHGDIEDVAHVLSPFLYELIRSLLHVEPSERTSAKDLVQLIENHMMQQ